MARISEREAGGRNVLAFLDMIACSELGGLLAVSDDGYNVIVGSTTKKLILMDSYADHPRKVIDLPKQGIKSTAAGRYQLLAKYFDPYAKLLGLSNFGPINQDRISIQLIRERRALDDVIAGRVEVAIRKCCKTWASFPGAGYGQHEHDLSHLLAAYRGAGGKGV